MATETTVRYRHGSVSIEATAMRRRHPEWTQAKIAGYRGVSKQRVAQVLLRAGLPTAAWKPPKPTCGTCDAVLTDRMQAKGTCQSCISEARHTYKPCHSCGKVNRYRLTEIHRKKANLITGRRDQRHFFCNKVCFGRWFGVNYGGSNKKGATR